MCEGGGGWWPNCQFANLGRSGVTVAAGAEPGTEKKWGHLVKEVASMLTGRDWYMNYCGAKDGLGGAIARQVVASGGKVRAVVVKGAKPRPVLNGVEVTTARSYHDRSRKLFGRPSAVLFLPGGAGTVAALGEVALLTVAGVMPNRTILLNASGWYDPVLHFYEKLYRQGICQDPPDKLFHPVEKVRDARDLIDRFMGERV